MQTDLGSFDTLFEACKMSAASKALIYSTKKGDHTPYIGCDPLMQFKAAYR
ncbi:MAG: hypothetical protein [Olavius algarvensis Delta 4 endosymbiont]|nr:MAG: hypothetical protein [Olavius algarvensis Delta 4 endosymbiont]